MHGAELPREHEALRPLDVAALIHRDLRATGEPRSSGVGRKSALDWTAKPSTTMSLRVAQTTLQEIKSQTKKSTPPDIRTRAGCRVNIKLVQPGCHNRHGLSLQY